MEEVRVPASSKAFRRDPPAAPRGRRKDVSGMDGHIRFQTLILPYERPVNRAQPFIGAAIERFLESLSDGSGVGALLRSQARQESRARPAIDDFARFSARLARRRFPGILPADREGFPDFPSDPTVSPIEA